MLFSVIIPVFNVEKYLDKCIQSILQQSNHDFELILVDDGSWDKSPEICDRYQNYDKRVHVIHKKNEGVVSARQTGVELSAGEYLVFVDADDWVDTEYLSSLEEYIHSNNEPDIVCCGYIAVSTNCFTKIPMEIRVGYYTYSDIEKEIYPILIDGYDGRSFSPQLWAKAFSRTLYYQYQLKNSLVIMGEDEVCVKPCVYHANSMVVGDRCLYYYRQNPDSVSRGKKPYLWDGPILRSEHLKKHIDVTQYDFQAQLYRHAVHSVFTVASSQFRRHESYSVIVSDIKKHLDDEYYLEAIGKCRFKRLKDKIILWSLKHRLYWFMRLFCRIKL